MWKKFNPKLSDFLAEKKDITVIGAFWAGIWRWYLCVIGISFAVMLVAKVLE